MSSYVYMRILESRPRRYDRGIAWLSLGQSEKVKRRIAESYARPGVRILDVGCGTGTLALLAARQGAEVVAFDVSGAMLSVAREKVAREGLQAGIEFHEMGVAGMDQFADTSFDLVAATLVFSELSDDERRYALRHARRILKQGGRAAIADEVRPRRPAKRVLHGLVRFPLAVLTFALTQTTTRAVESLEDLVRTAGFRIEAAERNWLESFLYVVAVKENA